MLTAEAVQRIYIYIWMSYPAVAKARVSYTCTIILCILRCYGTICVIYTSRYTILLILNRKTWYVYFYYGCLRFFFFRFVSFSTVGRLAYAFNNHDLLIFFLFFITSRVRVDEFLQTNETFIMSSISKYIKFNRLYLF